MVSWVIHIKLSHFGYTVSSLKFASFKLNQDFRLTTIRDGQCERTTFFLNNWVVQKKTTMDKHETTWIVQRNEKKINHLKSFKDLDRS